MHDVEVFSSLEAARATWRQFESEGRALPFQAFDWIDVWFDLIGRESGMEPTPTAVRTADGEPLLFLPVGIRQEGRRRVLSWLGEDLGDQLAPILTERAAAIEPEGFATLWASVVAELPSPDIARFRRQPSSVHGLANPFSVGGTPDGSSFSTRLQSDWDAYFKSKAKSTRRGDSRRQRRRLGDIGTVEFCLVEDPAAVPGFVETMIDQKRRRYDETGRADMFDDPRYGEFYRRLAERHSGTGVVQMSALTVDGETIATDLSVRSHHALHGLMTTHAAGEWKRYSPGRLLTEWVLERCCDEGIEIFDFSNGGERYKQEWCEIETPLYRRTLATSLRGRAALAPRLAKDYLRSSPLSGPARQIRAAFARAQP